VLDMFSYHSRKLRHAHSIFPTTELKVDLFGMLVFNMTTWYRAEGVNDLSISQQNVLSNTVM